MKYKKKILIIATNFCRHSKELPIKRQIAEQVAGSGISHRDLKNVFEKFIAKGLAGVLSLPPSSSKAPRVAKTTRISAKITWTLQSSRGDCKIRGISISITTWQTESVPNRLISRWNELQSLKTSSFVSYVKMRPPNNKAVNSSKSPGQRVNHKMAK